MKQHEVIASGSDGNCEIYFGSIAIDMGVPFSAIKPHMFQLQLVLLTHWHLDHFNIETIRRLSASRPTLRFGCGGWMVHLLEGVRNVDVFELGKWYDYKAFRVSMGKCYHDVPNAFYRLEKGGYKIFRATDTCTLEGIEAKDYSLYAIEHSYDADEIMQIIAEKESRGEFAYERGAMRSHLSEQAARQFIFNNAGPNYEVLRLHESKREYSKI